MTKCDFCQTELMEGGSPCCVEACPTRALSFGDYDELTGRYGEKTLVAPLPPFDITRPHLVIIPPRQARSLNNTDGLIQNPEEVKDA